MSDRIWLLCNECNDRVVIAKRFTMSLGWRFFCAPKEGVRVIDADSEEELKAQFDVGGLNCEEKVMLKKATAFNKWLEKHKICNDFSVEVEN